MILHFFQLLNVYVGVTIFSLSMTIIDMEIQESVGAAAVEKEIEELDSMVEIKEDQIGIQIEITATSEPRQIIPTKPLIEIHPGLNMETIRIHVSIQIIISLIGIGTEILITQDEPQATLLTPVTKIMIEPQILVLEIEILTFWLQMIRL